eukprot:28605-Pelagomonas_calceolata.AAC.8
MGSKGASVALVRGELGSSTVTVPKGCILSRQRTAEVLSKTGVCTRIENESGAPGHACDGIFNFCSNDGVSCSVDREVKAGKFAAAMWSRTCTPALGSKETMQGRGNSLALWLAITYVYKACYAARKLLPHCTAYQCKLLKQSRQRCLAAGSGANHVMAVDTQV